MSGWNGCPDCGIAHDRHDAEPRCDACIREIEDALTELTRPWLRGEQRWGDMLAAKDEYLQRRRHPEAEAAS